VSNQSVTGEIILEGFRSLKETMEHGFDGVNRRIDAVETRLDRRITELEHRMMRRFDGIDERLDNHERRITTLEAKR
jgi:tetrahydromethanopterin S-methyltransferase subunit G